MRLSKEYIDYIESKDWKRLRASAFARYGKSCQCCGSTRSIHGHHLIYRYPLTEGRVEDIMPLCEICHNIVHATPKIDRGFRMLPRPKQRREFIIRCLRQKAAEKPIQAVKVKRVPAPVQIRTPKPGISPEMQELHVRISQAKAREALIKRAVGRLVGVRLCDLALMSTEAIKRRLRKTKKREKKRRDVEGYSIVSQLREQMKANPNAKHFVFV